MWSSLHSTAVRIYTQINTRIAGRLLPVYDLGTKGRRIRSRIDCIFQHLAPYAGLCGASVPINHKCSICRSIASVAPSGISCPSYTGAAEKKAALAARRAHAQRLLEKTGGRIRMVAGSLTKYRCLDCSTLFDSDPYRLLKGKGNGCFECAAKGNAKAKSVRSASTYKARLLLLDCTMLPTEDYVTAHIKIAHQCTSCGFNRGITPDFMLKLAKCTACAPRNKAKTVTASGKTFSVFGYEDVALTTLLKRHQASDINAYSEGSVPLVYYSHKKKQRRYMPDFYLPKTNTLIEVKGLATFGMAPFPRSKLTDKERFEETAAKAKACLASGYRYRLMLMVNARPKRLPPEWFLMTHKQIRTFLTR